MTHGVLNMLPDGLWSDICSGDQLGRAQAILEVALCSSSPAVVASAAAMYLRVSRESTTQQQRFLVSAADVLPAMMGARIGKPGEPLGEGHLFPESVTSESQPVIAELYKVAHPLLYCCCCCCHFVTGGLK